MDWLDPGLESNRTYIGTWTKSMSCVKLFLMAYYILAAGTYLLFLFDLHGLTSFSGLEPRLVGSIGQIRLRLGNWFLPWRYLGFNYIVWHGVGTLDGLVLVLRLCFVTIYPKRIVYSVYDVRTC